MELDRSVAVLVVKVGRYPLHHGGVGVIRSLGRLGVPVYAITEDRFTPAAVSRYLRGRFVWPTTGREDPGELVAGLLRIGEQIGEWMGGRPIALPTDDEAAVLLAEHAPRLAERFAFPAVPAALPRLLADKFALSELCRAHGVPTPAAARPGSVDELRRAAAELGYPVVLKNAEPWSRLAAPAVASTTVVRSEAELLARAAAWTAMPQVLVQEYLPDRDGTVDWISQPYCDGASVAQPVFTGVKVRSWPPRAGVTTLAFSTPNEELAEMTAGFCRSIGYRGIADLDWRFDPVDGRYQLLDFNPRVGAQFRLFQTEAGVDLARALHLDLTGRPTPAGAPVAGRVLRVENLDMPALWAEWRATGHRPRHRLPGKAELAWLAADDLLPAAVAAARSGRLAVGMLSRGLRRALRNRGPAPMAPSRYRLL